MSNNDDKFESLMASKKFDVEHALGMYAYSFCELPAEAIYDDDAIKFLGERAKSCHIYLIGYVPKIDLKKARPQGSKVMLDMEALGVDYPVSLAIPDGLSFKEEGGLWFLSDAAGQRYAPNAEQIIHAFGTQHEYPSFEVVYVGQAYGTDGSRNALDRLKKHETLQKIALEGAPDGYRLQLLLLEVHPSNQLFTFFNAWAQDKSQGEQRISSGLDKLFETNEHERITLYEASLISYFQPIYNKQLKNSYPSTNLKVLADCYEKDFSSVVAEICFDNFHYRLFSDAVEKSFDHFVSIDLHTAEERKVFFAT